MRSLGPSPGRARAKRRSQGPRAGGVGSRRAVESDFLGPALWGYHGVWQESPGSLCDLRGPPHRVNRSFLGRWKGGRKTKESGRRNSKKATFAGVQTEDWGQFMHICDIINTAHDGPKDAVKALKKRISKNYNHKEIQLTLSLIDMCMQNCGPSFQSLIVKKEFVKDSLVKLLNPRYTLPLHIQNRILNFIKTWSQGFPGGVDVSEVKEVYLDLLKKGVRFPPTEIEAETAGLEISSDPPASVPTAPALPSVIAPKNSTITLVPEQIGKLHSELDMVKMNVRVMSAILMENVPGSENREDIELLQKLYKTGREMQERIMDLLVVVENEDVTVELIQVNEDLNNAILGCERFTRNQQRILEQNKNQMEDANTTSEPSAPSCDLLDLSPSLPMSGGPLGEFNSLNAQLSDLSFTSPSPAVTNNVKPSLHPQMDLLDLENTETSLVIMLCYHTILGLLKGPAKTSPQVMNMRIFRNIQIQYYYSRLAYRPFQQRHQTRHCHPCPAITQQ
ncbi:TOM1-like protein 1 isoform X3 [Diceros bicornis minor]|uniref:TOM1-like protein 1 isoform X3 n=2 Tax=Diceros bicornis minor TaxID=77932 RepID=UPI0026F1A38F|nr:TOM1-like protein 1 isoform X3 [Diceros bicornis minor]